MSSNNRRTIFAVSAVAGLAGVSWFLYSRFFGRKSESLSLGHVPASGEQPHDHRHFGDGERDLVEEGSWESFPASDPPSPGHFT